MKDRLFAFKSVGLVGVSLTFCLFLLMILVPSVRSGEIAKAQYMQYNQDKVIKTIDEQLVGINLEAVRKKEKLIIEKDIESIQKAIYDNKLTYTELTAFYLDRIRHLDKTDKGLNAIAAINPYAIKEAKKYDETKDFKHNNSLFGMPITVKDNILTKNITTTVGMEGLKNFIPQKDADVIKRLKRSNVIILGKANLSELANYVSPNMPNGYSSSIGQTINPYKPLELSPLGSSAGSAVSVTSNMGVASIATETTGSIISPSYINSVVGMKPPHHLVSGEGIFPLSPSLDTVGVIAKSVIDAKLVYNSIINNSSHKIKQLDRTALKGARIGFIKSDQSNAKKLKIVLQKLGARVEVVNFDYEGMDNIKLINSEFPQAVSEFSKKNSLPFKSLEELVTYNKKDLGKRAKFGQEHLETAIKTKIILNLLNNKLNLRKKTNNVTKEI